MDNLFIYEAGRAVPKEAQKPFSNGRFSGTDINPMWRIKKLTELFGPCGIGWYIQPVNREIITASDGTKCALMSINLFVSYNGQWSAPIYGEGGNTFETTTKSGYVQVSDEAYKMAETDAISNAAKMLGIGADVWFANDKEHGTKYDVLKDLKDQAAVSSSKNADNVAELKKAVAGISVDDVIAQAAKASKPEEVNAIWKEYQDKFTGDEQARLRDECIKIGKALKTKAA